MTDVARLQVVEVSKHYGPTVALNNASFAVADGDVHALIGENGAGKSTLVKLLSGLIRPDAGEIRVAGESVRLHSPRDALGAGIATAYQELTVIPYLTVAQNLLLGREPRNRLRLVSTNRLVQQASGMLQRWELAGVSPEALVSELSLAERQQLELVRSLDRTSQVLLLDEPTAALGAQQVDWLFRQVRRLRDKGKTLVFISHRMSEVREIADKITVLRNGHEVATFAPHEASDRDVIQMMVGRDVKATLRKTRDVSSEVRLDVEDLRCEPGLKGLSFSLRAGEIVGLGALQGNGQLELFLSLFGARRAASGTIRLDGQPYKPRSPYDAIHRGLGISLVPEDRKAEGVMVDMSGLANITLPSLRGLATAGVVRTPRQRRAALSAARGVNVTPQNLVKEVRALSGGNQQKIALGKWLVADTKLLLMYDPTRGVDVATKAEIFAMMQEMAEAGKSILFYSTDIEELLGVSDRIVVLYRGVKAAELSQSEMTRDRVLTAMLGVARDDSVSMPVQAPEAAL